MGLSTELFFKKIEEYYGNHDKKIVMQITKEYILRTYKQEMLSKLLNAVYRSHPSSWGFPDVSAIESAHDKFIKTDKRDLKENKINEYKSPIAPLTDEELIESEENGSRDKWKKLVGIAADKATDSIDPEKLEEIKKELGERND